MGYCNFLTVFVAIQITDKINLTLASYAKKMFTHPHIQSETTAYETDFKNKHGLDKLELMCRFLQIVESKKSNVKSDFNRFKSWLVQQLGRGISKREEIALAQGIVNYIRSEAGTNERGKAISYLFEGEWLDQPATNGEDSQ